MDYLTAGWNTFRFVMTPEELPCVVMAPFTLFLMNGGEGNAAVSTRVSYIQYLQFTVGLELSFPKRIQFAEGNRYGASKGT